MATTTDTDGTSSEPSMLCDKCKHFGFSKERFHPRSDDSSHDESGASILDMGYYRDFSKRATCPICSMVAKAAREFPSARRHPDALEDLLQDLTKSEGHYQLVWKHEVNDSMCFEIQRKEVDDNLLRDILRPTAISKGRIISMPTSIVVEPASGRLIDDQINMGLVRNWLSFCTRWHSSGSHGNHCEQLVFPRSVDPRGADLFRAIDVVEMCIVRPPSTCSYVALSYKWGGAGGLQAKIDNIKGLELQGALVCSKNQIPNTIQDAIALTKDMGQKYLWVDQLCIVQDDLEQKQLAIDSMIGVYAFAHFTIIAADGDDANAGLRGYGITPRNYEQMSVKLEPDLQLLLVPNLVSTLSATPYEERAWTYQERILSRRCLTFLNGQVYFRCRRALWREDIRLEWEQLTTAYTAEGQSLCKYLDPSSSYRGQKREFPLTFDGGFLERPESTHLDFCTSYAHLIAAITRRRLSFQSDALNAALGVLKPLALAGPEPKHLLAGIPASLLDEAVLWTPGPSTLTRRKGFPSWSWTGWVGPIEEAAALVVEPTDTETTTVRCFRRIHVTRFYVPEFARDRKNFMEQKPSFMARFRSPKSLSGSCFRLLDIENVPVVPFKMPKVQLDPPRRHLLWIWAVAFKAQWSAIVRRANERVYARHYESDVVLEACDGQENFAGRVLCHWSGYPEQPGPSWDETDLVVIRTFGNTSDRKDHVLTDWLITRLGLARFEQKFWGIGRKEWRNHIHTGSENTEPVCPDKSDSPFRRFGARPDANFFYCLLIHWQEDGVAERIGIGMILETAIRDAVAPGPVWKEILLA